MFAIGNLAFALAPFVLGHGSGGYDASTLQAIGWTVALALPVAVGLASWRVPSGPPMPSGRISLRAALNSARGNHPLHWYASIFLLTTLRSEEHTPELQSLMRISYAVFWLKKKKKN